MDLFELFGSVEELEENVKGVPELPKEEAETVETETLFDEVKVSVEQVVMQKTFRNRTTGKTAVIAYLNYNKVYQKVWDEKPSIYQFEQSKDAVDYYVSQMERFSEDKQIERIKEQETLREAVLIPWTKEEQAHG